MDRIQTNLGSDPHKTQASFDSDSLQDLFYNPKTKRAKPTRTLLKIIGGRIEKFGNCITKQVVFGYEMYNFGYGKVLEERQIRRITNKLFEAGLITYKRSSSKRSVYTYDLTDLGWSAYYHFAKNNGVKLSTEGYVKHSSSSFYQKKCPVEHQKMSGRESFKTHATYRPPEKNVRSNRSYINNNRSSSLNYEPKILPRDFHGNLYRDLTPEISQMNREEKRRLIERTMKYGDDRINLRISDPSDIQDPTLKALMERCMAAAARQKALDEAKAPS